MRPTAKPQSAIRAPLNHILATEANVRVLRVLATRRTPISAAELSRQTELQRSTVSRSLRQLDELGVIQFTGVAPKAQAMLREPGLLGKALRQLFHAERVRVESLFEGLGAAASKLRVMSVWLGHSIGLGIDRPGELVSVYVLDRPDVVAMNAQLFRQSLESLERKINVTFDVHEVTLADLGTSIGPEQLEGTTYIAGVPPSDLFDRVNKLTRQAPSISTHASHDAASLERARRIARAIKRDPSVIEGALEYIEKRRRIASPGERRELEEWRRILRNSSATVVRKLLTDPGPRSTRLRQTLPFFAAIDD